MQNRLPAHRSLAGALALALATGGLAGCSLVGASKTCSGTGDRLKRLERYGILDSKPSGASAPKGFEAVDAQCVDDSGDAWLSAERLYSFPGRKSRILEHYRAAAAADGWKFEEDHAFKDIPPEQEGICFTKGGDGDAVMLTVDFHTEGYEPEPDFGTATGYRVEVGSEADGATVRCWQ